MRGRSLLLGVAVSAAGLVGAGCGTSAPSGSLAGPGASCASTSTSPSIRIVGGNAAQRRLARRVDRWFGSSVIATVTFTNAATVPLAQQGVANLIVSAAGTLSCQSVDRGLIQWESDLFVSTYVSLMGADPAASVQWAVTGRGGANLTGRPALDTTDVRAPTAAAIRQQTSLLTAAARADQAQVVSLRVIDTPERAIAITLRVSDPANFLKNQARAFLQLLDDPRITLAGHYVGLVDSSGQLVWDAFGLPDEGGDFVIPALAGCNPILNLGQGLVRACPAP